MIDLTKLKLDFEEYTHIKLESEGSVALCNIDALGFNIGIEVEGSFIGIKTTKGEVVIHHIYKTKDHTEALNEFLGFLRDSNSLNG